MAIDPDFPPLKKVFTGVELQSAHVCFAMAGVAFLREQRTDFRLEEISVNPLSK